MCISHVIIINILHRFSLLSAVNIKGAKYVYVNHRKVATNLIMATLLIVAALCEALQAQEVQMFEVTIIFTDIL